MYDNQLKLPGTCNKSKLPEEFKKFKIQQKLQVGFTTDEKVLKEIIFVAPWIVSYKQEFEDIIIDELIDKEHNETFTKV